MLYGLSKIAVLGGHGDGANAIPAEFAATAALKAYREGTAMRRLADAISAATGVPNLRTESTDLSWKERAARAKAAGAELAVELHTNWSVTGGKPNGGIFLVIVPMHNPVHDTEKQKAMATWLFRPLADAMGMAFQICTKDGTGGGHDWYSFLNQCNGAGIPYPMIVEHGYHIDYASNEEKFQRLIVNRYREICGLSAPGTIGTEVANKGAIEVSETEPHSYIVHAGTYLSRDNGADEWAMLKAAGYTTAYWWKNSDGVYHLRTGRYDTLAYAVAEAEKLAALGLQAGIVVI